MGARQWSELGLIKNSIWTILPLLSFLNWWIAWMQFHCHHCYVLCLRDMTATQSIHSCQWVGGFLRINWTLTNVCRSIKSMWTRIEDKWAQCISRHGNARVSWNITLSYFSLFSDSHLFISCLCRKTDFFLLKKCILCTVLKIETMLRLTCELMIYSLIYVFVERRGVTYLGWSYSCRSRSSARLGTNLWMHHKAQCTRPSTSSPISPHNQYAIY